MHPPGTGSHRFRAALVPLLVSLVVSLVGCASTRPLPYAYLSQVHSVAVERPGDADPALPKTRSASATKGGAIGALKGAGTGIGACSEVMGGGSGGLAAAAWFLCSMVAAPIGLVVGGATGSSDGAKIGLSPEHQQRFKSVIDDLQHEQALADRFTSNFTEAAARHRTVGSGSGGELTIKLRLAPLEFVQQPQEQLALILRACADFAEPMAGHGPKQHHLCESSISPMEAASDWLANDGAKVRASVVGMTRDLAGALNRQLWCSPTSDSCTQAPPPAAADAPAEAAVATQSDPKTTPVPAGHP